MGESNWAVLVLFEGIMVDCCLVILISEGFLKMVLFDFD